MRRWFLRAAIAVVVLAAAAAVAAWLTVRASLPQLDGELEGPGLAHPATISRDDAGIPTITARTREDLAYATGFAHGQDRFFQMDLIRRQAAGELSALFGAVALDTDKRYRFHRFRDRAREVLAAAPMRPAGKTHRAVKWPRSIRWLRAGYRYSVVPQAMTRRRWPRLANFCACRG